MVVMTMRAAPEGGGACSTPLRATQRAFHGIPWKGSRLKRGRNEPGLSPELSDKSVEKVPGAGDLPAAAVKKPSPTARMAGG